MVRSRIVAGRAGITAAVRYSGYTVPALPFGMIEAAVCVMDKFVQVVVAVNTGNSHTYRELVRLALNNKRGCFDYQSNSFGLFFGGR